MGRGDEEGGSGGGGEGGLGRKGEGADEGNPEQSMEGNGMESSIKSHEDLEAYRIAFDAAMKIFEASRSFAGEDRYSLPDQRRRSSRSVCTNPAEARRKRQYEAAWVSKLNDAETEAVETQVWLKFSLECKYLDENIGKELAVMYDSIIRKLVTMINNPAPWILTGLK